jgi:predicted RNA-binding protein with EMAP domain
VSKILKAIDNEIKLIDSMIKNIKKLPNSFEGKAKSVAQFEDIKQVLQKARDIVEIEELQEKEVCGD